MSLSLLLFLQLSLTSVVADGICSLAIDTSGVLSDTASWRELWETGVALNGMCIRSGREGLRINLGIYEFTLLHSLGYLIVVQVPLVGCIWS